MALKIEVELGRVCNFAIDDGTRWTIATAVSLPWVLREESDMMAFADNDNCDGWFDVEFGTGGFECRKLCDVYFSVSGGQCSISYTGHTLIQYLFELSFGDTITIKYYTRGSAGPRLAFDLRAVLHVHFEHILIENE